MPWNQPGYRPSVDGSDELTRYGLVTQSHSALGTAGKDHSHTMHITRSDRPTSKGPADWFTGDVYVDPIAAPDGGSRISASAVHFSPGARTAWHTHPHGQTIFVLEGVGRCQRDGGPVEEIRPGDRVFFEPGERHWHGAAPDRLMLHIAMLEVDAEGRSATWGEHVSDAAYLGATE